jgi:hypothetical protein
MKLVSIFLIFTLSFSICTSRLSQNEPIDDFYSQVEVIDTLFKYGILQSYIFNSKVYIFLENEILEYTADLKFSNGKYIRSTKGVFIEGHFFYSRDNKFYLLELSTLTEIAINLQLNFRDIFPIDKSRLAFTTFDSKIKIVNFKTRAILNTFEAEDTYLLYLNEKIYLRNNDNTVSTIDVNTGEKETLKFKATSLKALSHTKIVATFSVDGIDSNIIIYDIISKQIKTTKDTGRRVIPLSGDLFVINHSSKTRPDYCDQSVLNAVTGKEYRLPTVETSMSIREIHSLGDNIFLKVTGIELELWKLLSN